MAFHVAPYIALAFPSVFLANPTLKLLNELQHSVWIVVEHIKVTEFDCLKMSVCNGNNSLKIKVNFLIFCSIAYIYSVIENRKFTLEIE